MMERPAKRKKRSLKGEIPITPFPNLNGNNREALEQYKRELWLILKADPLEMFWQDEATGLWRLRTPDQLPYRIRVAIKSLHRNEEGNHYYELHDKNKAADRLIKILMEEEKRYNRPKTPVSCNGETLRIGFTEEEV